MGVLSKILFSRIPYNCYEAVHTWNENCNEVRLQAFVDAYKTLLPLYLLLNSSSILLRYKEVSYATIGNMLRNVLVKSNRSAAALGTIFFTISLILCNLGQFFGYFNPPMTFVAMFVAAAIGSLIETDGRLHLYVVYMLQLTFEMFLTIADDYQIRGHPMMTPLVLASSIALHTYFSRTINLSRTNFTTFLKLIVGKPNLSLVDPNNNSSSTNNINCDACASTAEKDTTQGYTSSGVCRHEDTCSQFILKRCALVFSCAVGGSLGLRLLSSMGRIMSQVRKGNALTTTLGRVFYPKGMSVAVDLGLALATFSAAFNGISCYLRRTEKRDAPWYAIPSSVVASFAAYWLWPSQRITIYALCNTLYDFYMMGVAKQMVPTIPHGPNLAFASICAVIFSVGGIKPHYIRKSYVSFINRILGNRVDRINWSAISHAGFDSARVYKENLPAILNPDYVSTRYMQTMWVWSLADYMYKIHKRPVV